MLKNVIEFAKLNNIEITETQLAQLEDFCDFLAEKNKVMNLTAIEDEQAVEVKHLIDSLEAVQLIGKLRSDEPFSLVDVGCGAGFPGIPLKVIFPDDKFVLLDSLQKRITFVTEAANKIGLENIECMAARAEEFGHTQARESFDFCVSRAVAQMNVLLEYCLPLVKVGGYCLMYKAQDFEEELLASKKALEELGGEYVGCENFELPLDYGKRTILMIKKVRQTPEKYPRRPGKPSKSPIR